MAMKKSDDPMTPEQEKAAQAAADRLTLAKIAKEEKKREGK